MNFEEIQKNWQEQSEKQLITINTDTLLKEVRRNKQSFDTSIFWRDVREAGGSFVMMIIIAIISIKEELSSLLFPAFACLFVGTFMVIDRMKLKKKYPYNKKNASLAGCVKVSLAHVNHQIWLLKNVHRWYLMPFTVGISIFWLWMGWVARDSMDALLLVGRCFIFLFIVFFGIYYLNQWGVKKYLIPRKEELEELLKSIQSRSSENSMD